MTYQEWWPRVSDIGRPYNSINSSCKDGSIQQIKSSIEVFYKRKNLFVNRLLPIVRQSYPSKIAFW